MSITHKITYHGLKLLRMGWYQLRYRINKWKTIGGIRLPVYLKYGYPVLRFMDNEKYEQHELAILKSCLQPGDKVLELGTGIGFISAYCARIVGSENVFTFEGNPEQSVLINEVYKANGVKPENRIAMLGAGNAARTFYSNSASFLASSVNASKEERGVLVPQYDLNSTIADIKPNYLVMDIEGGEYDIFRMIDFQSITKLQFELHPVVLSAEQLSEIFIILANAGFMQSAPLGLPNNYFFQKASNLNSAD